MNKNDITGDRLVSKTVSEAYQDNWERIFGKKQAKIEPVISDKSEPDNSLVEPNKGDSS